MFTLLTKAEIVLIIGAENKFTLHEDRPVARKNQHVVPTPDGNWGVRGEGNSRLTRKTPTQSEAIDAAKEIAQNQKKEVVIHRENGQIRDRDSYGYDPYPPEDKKH
jgi:hypothetical protein